MGSSRKNGNLLFAGFIFAVLCLKLSYASTTDDEYEGWLKYISDTSDPISDDSVKSVETSIQQQVYTKTVQGESQLTGFDAWQAKQEALKGSQSKFTQTRKDSGESTTVYVAQDGSGDFSTIADALASIPESNSQRRIIFIKAGTYYERFIIPESQKYIALVGEGADKSIISGDATAGQQYGEDELLRTYRSCTVCVNSDHFIAKNICFQNTAPAPEPGAVGKQAVALRISGDKAAFYNVAVLGAQDTLYDHRGRHFFKNCYIQGSIDFIFGNGRSYYKDCHLHSIASSFGSLTAQKRNETDQNTGFSFVNAQVDGTGIIYLGRAWGNYSRVVYSWSYFNEMIIPEGWQDWGLPQRQTEVFYAQYQCYGPGSDNDQRVWWAKRLSDKQARPFLTDAFINGHTWIEDDDDF